MKTEQEVFTQENRPVCKTATRCNGKMAALSKGVLAYKGFCSGCYQEDKAERRANALRDEQAGIVPPAKARSTGRANRSSTSSSEALSGIREGSSPDGHKLANKEDQRTKLASDKQQGRSQKRPPGGFGVPKPGAWPTVDDVVQEMSAAFGWCMTGHHEGMEDADPDGRTGLLAGTFPVLCPGTVWLGMQGHWASCPCLCHKTNEAGQSVHESLVTA